MDQTTSASQPDGGTASTSAPDWLAQAGPIAAALLTQQQTNSTPLLTQPAPTQQSKPEAELLAALLQQLVKPNANQPSPLAALFQQALVQKPADSLEDRNAPKPPHPLPPRAAPRLSSVRSPSPQMFRPRITPPQGRATPGSFSPRPRGVNFRPGQQTARPVRPAMPVRPANVNARQVKPTGMRPVGLEARPSGLEPRPVARGPLRQGTSDGSGAQGAGNRQQGMARGSEVGPMVQEAVTKALAELEAGDPAAAIKHLYSSSSPEGQIIAAALTSMEQRVMTLVAESVKEVAEQLGREAAARVVLAEAKAARAEKELQDTRAQALTMMSRLQESARAQVAEVEHRLRQEKARASFAEARVASLEETLKSSQQNRPGTLETENLTSQKDTVSPKKGTMAPLTPTMFDNGSPQAVLGGWRGDKAAGASKLGGAPTKVSPLKRSNLRKRGSQGEVVNDPPKGSSSPATSGESQSTKSVAEIPLKVPGPAPLEDEADSVTGGKRKREEDEVERGVQKVAKEDEGGDVGAANGKESPGRKRSKSPEEGNKLDRKSVQGAKQLLAIKNSRT